MAASSFDATDPLGHLDPSCVAVSEIYGLSETKALAIVLSPDNGNITSTWIATEDDVLLREKQADSSHKLQQTRALRTFVWHDRLVVHTPLPFEIWCKSDCGCLQCRSMF